MEVDTQGRDKNRVWFVTRVGAGGPDLGPRVYRLDAPKSLLKGNANWTSWGLNETELPPDVPPLGFTGGLKKNVPHTIAATYSSAPIPRCSASTRRTVNTADDMPLAGGQTAQYPVTATSSSLALIAIATADDPLAQIGVEIFDPSGLFVASSAPTPGAALASVLLPVPGNYTMKVRNYGITPILATPRTIVREPWLP